MYMSRPKIGEYRINIQFSDGKQRIANFENAFSQLQGYCAQYRHPSLFQKFAIDNGNLVWGDDLGRHLSNLGFVRRKSKLFTYLFTKYKSLRYYTSRRPDNATTQSKTTPKGFLWV